MNEAFVARVVPAMRTPVRPLWGSKAARGFGQLATGVLLAWLLIAVEVLFFLYFGSAWLGLRVEPGLEQGFRELWLSFGAHGRGPTVAFLWLHLLVALHLWLSARAETLRGRRWRAWLTLAPAVLLAILGWWLYRFGQLPPVPVADLMIRAPSP